MKPASSLAVEIETSDGTLYRLDGDSLKPKDRPQGLTFRTQRGDGFADASFTVKRSVLRDYPDLELASTVRFIDAQGNVAYEGRNINLGRETGDGQSIQVGLAGWMASAKDRRFREIYIDRDVSHWQQTPSIARQTALISGSPKYKLASGQVSTSPAPSGTGQAVTLQFSRIAKSGSYYPLAETWYAPDLPIASATVTYSDKDAVTGAALTSNFVAALLVSSDDVFSAFGFTSLIGTTGTATVTSSGTRKFAAMQLYYSGTDTASDGSWTAWFANPYVVGTHGLTVASGGLTASQMIRDSCARFCPNLDTSGIQDTTYPIQHAEAIVPTYPYDFWLDLNKAHLWDLSVWEDRVLNFRPPATLDDYDWQVRTDDPGVTLSFGGDSFADMANGVEVTFTDLLTGNQRCITPVEYPNDLGDTDPDNPLNRAGDPKWLPYDIPFPCVEADAVQYGRAYLAEAIRAKSPVQINCGFSIRDRAGNWQPTHKVRAEHRIAITDHPNDAPRRIIDTSYSHDGRGLTISADRASSQLEAVVDRISLARTVAGL